VLAFGGHFRQVNIDSPDGGNDDAVHWFEDAGNEDVGDGELSRQGDRLALVRSYGANTHLAIYRVGGGIGSAAPAAACFSGADPSLAGPSWSPDGTRLAFQDAEGIEVMPLPSVIAGDCPGASSSALILPGASAPDWGPAAIRTDAGSYAGSRSTGLRVTAPGVVGLGSASRGGIPIRVRGSAAGRMIVAARVDGRVAAAGSGHAAAGAWVTFRLRLHGQTLRLVRHSHARRLVISVTLIPPAGPRITRTASVRITG
jgi:WD40-like Beta Propeller Repeat